MVDRRTMLRLLGAGSVAASLELLGSDAAAAFEPFDFEPTTVRNGQILWIAGSA